MDKTNGELKIEKGIPIPLGGRKIHGFNAVLKKMKVGDSVVLPRSTSAANSLAKQALGTGNYTIRKIDESSCRVWKIA